jgi:tetratricopeptide (TPR) repeat protein
LEAQGYSALPNLQNAIALHQQGQLGQAESIYRQLLEIDSRNAVALHMLGVISYQTGNYQFAVDWIGRAIEINPNIASYYSNLGNALQELKQFDAAVVSYEKAISLKPEYAEAYYNLGNALQELKQFLPMYAWSGNVDLGSFTPLTVPLQTLFGGQGVTKKFTEVFPVEENPKFYDVIGRHTRSCKVWQGSLYTASATVPEVKVKLFLSANLIENHTCFLIILGVILFFQPMPEVSLTKNE